MSSIGAADRKDPSSLALQELLSKLSEAPENADFIPKIASAVRIWKEAGEAYATRILPQVTQTIDVIARYAPTNFALLFNQASDLFDSSRGFAAAAQFFISHLKKDLNQKDRIEIEQNVGAALANQPQLAGEDNLVGFFAVASQPGPRAQVAASLAHSHGNISAVTSLLRENDPVVLGALERALEEPTRDPAYSWIQSPLVRAIATIPRDRQYQELKSCAADNAVTLETMEAVILLARDHGAIDQAITFTNVPDTIAPLLAVVKASSRDALPLGTQVQRVSVLCALTSTMASPLQAKSYREILSLIDSPVEAVSLGLECLTATGDAGCLIDLALKLNPSIAEAIRDKLPPERTLALWDALVGAEARESFLRLLGLIENRAAVEALVAARFDGDTRQLIRAKGFLAYELLTDPEDSFLILLKSEGWSERAIGLVYDHLLLTGTLLHSGGCFANYYGGILAVMDLYLATPGISFDKKLAVVPLVGRQISFDHGDEEYWAKIFSRFSIGEAEELNRRLGQVQEPRIEVYRGRIRSIFARPTSAEVVQALKAEIGEDTQIPHCPGQNDHRKLWFDYCNRFPQYVASKLDEPNFDELFTHALRVIKRLPHSEHRFAALKKLAQDLLPNETFLNREAARGSEWLGVLQELLDGIPGAQPGCDLSLGIKIAKVYPNQLDTRLLLRRLVASNGHEELLAAPGKEVDPLFTLVPRDENQVEIRRLLQMGLGSEASQKLSRALVLLKLVTRSHLKNHIIEMASSRAKDGPANAEGVWSDAERAPRPRVRSLERFKNGQEPIFETSSRNFGNFSGDPEKIYHDCHFACLLAAKGGDRDSFISLGQILNLWQSLGPDVRKRVRAAGSLSFQDRIKAVRALGIRWRHHYLWS